MSEEKVRLELRAATQAMVKRFISDLYINNLKPQGFRRSGHSFTRAHPEYLERIQIQGSSWNGLDSAPLILRLQEARWQFFVNVAVRLTNVPVANGHFHAECRIERLVDESEAIYELREAVFTPLVGRVAEHVAIASARLPERLAEIGTFAAKGSLCPLLRSENENTEPCHALDAQTTRASDG
jgi:hypothetical protein